MGNSSEYYFPLRFVRSKLYEYIKLTKLITGMIQCQYIVTVFLIGKYLNVIFYVLYM